LGGVVYQWKDADARIREVEDAGKKLEGLRHAVLRYRIPDRAFASNL